MMLQSNKIVLIGAQIMVHANNKIVHSLVKKFVFSKYCSFNMKKLLNTAACTTENEKAGANAQDPRRG